MQTQTGSHAYPPCHTIFGDYSLTHKAPTTHLMRLLEKLTGFFYPEIDAREKYRQEVLKKSKQHKTLLANSENQRTLPEV